MSILNKVSLAIVFLFIWACQADDKSSASDTQKDTPIAVLAKAPLPHSSDCYHHLTGTLGDHNIVAELIEFDNKNELEGGSLKGYYLYEKYGGPIALYGRFNKKGEIELTEQGTWDGEPHKITGNWDSSGRFKGEWISGNNKDRFPIILSNLNDNFLHLVCHQTQDSILAFPTSEQSPKAIFSAHWFDVQSENRTLNSFLNKSIKKGLSGDWAPTKGKQKDFIAAQKEAYFEEYRSEIEASIEDGLIDTTKSFDQLYSYNYSLDVSMEVYYNSPEILTLGYTYYTYTGGAHGIYGTEVSSYDLNSYKKIKLEDVFKEGYEQAVNEQLANAVRIKFELGEDTPLSEILFEDAITANENFGVTHKGIFFVYSPYEIAPYSAGEIELFVAFERVQEFLR